MTKCLFKTIVMIFLIIGALSYYYEPKAAQKYNIELYATSICPTCHKLEQELNNNHFKYKLYLVDKDNKKLVYLKQVLKKNTVPQMYTNHKEIGGYPESHKWIEEHK